jgi:hypothetical protein
LPASATAPAAISTNGHSRAPSLLSSDADVCEICGEQGHDVCAVPLTVLRSADDIYADLRVRLLEGELVADAHDVAHHE